MEQQFKAWSNDVSVETVMWLLSRQDATAQGTAAARRLVLVLGCSNIRCFPVPQVLGALSPSTSGADVGAAARSTLAGNAGGLVKGDARSEDSFDGEEDDEFDDGDDEGGTSEVSGFLTCWNGTAVS